MEGQEVIQTEKDLEGLIRDSGSPYYRMLNSV